MGQVVVYFVNRYIIFVHVFIIELLPSKYRSRLLALLDSRHFKLRIGREHNGRVMSTSTTFLKVIESDHTQCAHLQLIEEVLAPSTYRISLAVLAQVNIKQMLFRVLIATLHLLLLRCLENTSLTRPRREGEYTAVFA